MSEGPTITFPIPMSLEAIEIEVIKFTIVHFKGDKRAAADALGISLKTIYNKLAKDEERTKAGTR